MSGTPGSNYYSNSMISSPYIYSVNSKSKAVYMGACNTTGYLPCQFNYIKDTYDTTTVYSIKSITFGQIIPEYKNDLPLFVYYITTNYPYIFGYMTTLNFTPVSDNSNTYEYSFNFDYFNLGNDGDTVTSIFTPNMLIQPTTSNGITSTYGTDPDYWYTINPGIYNVVINGITQSQTIKFEEVYNGIIQTIYIQS